MQTNKGAGVASVVILILVIAVGAWFLLKDTETEDENTVAGTEMPVPGTDTEELVATGELFTVVYDENGFTPNSLTIPVGSTVVFQNSTGRKVSVASDDHPTHLLYPEFDQYKTDQRGNDTFSFTFEKVGTWNYHDHLNANMVGTVIVTE